MNRRIPLWILSALFALLAFQNCEDPRSKSQSASSASTSMQPALESGGQPYDGKPYIAQATCPDGTLVGTRIVVNHGQAMLYRENCRTIAPRLLAAADVSADGDQLTYAGQTLALERPAIPLPGVVSWFLQLTGVLQSRPASLFIVDMFGNEAADLANLRQAGHTVLCNISAGTVEDWNPDAGEFTAAEIGNAVAGGPGERWLDIRSENVRRIMLARLDLAKSKGCQGISFDAVEGYSNNSGFPLTREDQLGYNQMLAFAAHDRALILTLNNVPEFAANLSNIFDIAVAQECFTYGECAAYQPFISLGKPVLAVEYGPVSAEQCQDAKALSISLSYFNRQLDGARYETCPP